VDPSRALFIGDHLEIDARASTAAGLRGVWLNRNGAPGFFDGPIIRTLSELVTLAAQ
jgi:putative hydrolase of the HAD superfamily